MNGLPTLYHAYVRADQQALRVAEVVCDTMEPIDWPALISELQAGGASFQSIATAIGGNCSKGTVQRWANGSEPGYEYGKRLLAMRAACNSSLLRARKQV